MIYYDRTGAPEGIDFNKTRTSKECDICRYWYFLDQAFKFRQYVCNGCHNLLMKFVGLNGISVLSIHSVDYCCSIFLNDVGIISLTISNKISPSE